MLPILRPQSGYMVKKNNYISLLTSRGLVGAICCLAAGFLSVWTARGGRGRKVGDRGHRGFLSVWTARGGRGRKVGDRGHRGFLSVWTARGGRGRKVGDRGHRVHWVGDLFLGGGDPTRFLLQLRGGRRRGLVGVGLLGAQSVRGRLVRRLDTRARSYQSYWVSIQSHTQT